MINLKNRIKEKRKKFSGHWEKRWWKEFRFIVDVEYTGLTFLTDHLPGNDDMFNDTLFNTPEDVLRWWLYEDGLKKPSSYLFEKNYVHMYSIIDSMVENIYKGFFKFSNNWTKTWVDDYYNVLNKHKKDKKKKYISENKLRLDYLFTSIGKEYFPYSDNDTGSILEWNSIYDAIEAMVIDELASINYRKMLPSNYDFPKSWNFRKELDMFNGVFRMKRNQIVHKYFSDTDITIEYNDFIKAFCMASRIGIAVNNIIYLIEILTEDME